MAKTKSNRCRGGGNWSCADHDARTAKQIASLNKKRRRKLEKSSAIESQDHDEDAPPSTSNDDNIDRPSKQAKNQQQPPHHELPIHQIRIKKKSHRNNHTRLTSQLPTDTYKRAHLAHDNYDQIDAKKVRLATQQLQRKVNTLKERLESWDPITECKLEDEAERVKEERLKLHAHNRQLDIAARQQAEAEYAIQYAHHGVNSSTNRRKENLRSKPRPGPETWKLRGAARPAQEVYDFDVRYVDVHLLARDEANEIARRSKNIFCVCRGRFALDGGTEEEEENDDDDDDGEEGGVVNEEKNDNNKNNQQKKKKKEQFFPPPQPYCREYLSLLTQLASLHLHRRNYSSARSSFLEVIDLEGAQHSTSITNARYQLMNMYLHTNRPSSARKLCNTLQQSSDNSAWIQYSAALIEYVSWNVLHEEGSTSFTAEALLTQAIRGNVFVAYLLAFSSTFEKSMEYVNEVVNDYEYLSNSGSVLEAIEYGCCCYADVVIADNNDNEDDDRNNKMDKGMTMWEGTEGSLDWVRSVILRVLNETANEVGDGGNDDDDDDRLTKADLLNWEHKLNKEEEEFETERNEKEKAKLSLKLSDDGTIDYGEEYDNEGDDEEEEPDVVMYAGMFRTAMTWLEDAGEFRKAPTYDYINEQPTEEDEVDPVVEGGEENSSANNESDSNDKQSKTSAGEEEEGNSSSSSSSYDSSDSDKS